MRFKDLEEVVTPKELKAKKKQDKKNKVNFLDRIDLGKKFPDRIDKKIFRAGFLLVLIIQVLALMQTGFNFSPAWVECNTDSCENPFYGATGNVCERNPNLCDVEFLSKDQLIGFKPPLFARLANFLSWVVLFIAGVVNYKVCKKRRGD